MSEIFSMNMDAKATRNLNIIYYCDNNRHLICEPYLKENLHKMAKDLNIKHCWFHKDHYDIPKRRIEEITNKCILVETKTIIEIINNV